MRAIYTAKSYTGETKGGEITIKDERDLANQLRADGFMLTSFKELESGDNKKIKIAFMDRFSTIPLSEKMMFARNLSIMISSGLPLSKAIRNFTAQAKSKKFIKVLESIQEDLQTGSTLADGMTKYPGIFDELFVNMIRVGETGGNLEEVLNILAGQLEKEHELMSKVKGAMVYPSVILVAMMGIGVLMMIYVVPTLTSVFKDVDATLPASTQFIISASDALRNHPLLILGILVATAIFIKVMLSTSTGKKISGLIIINIPVIKNIVIKLNCARFSRIYSSLLKSGVSSVESLKI
ncbi:MAG TPA: type II secretion system F family protein, partial [Patescibacteria group bacterium]